MPRTRIRRWNLPDNIVRWNFIGELPPKLLRPDVLDAHARACEMWNTECSIRLRFTDDPKQANILARFGAVGPAKGKTLALSGLPVEGRLQVEQTFSNRVNWRLDGVCDGEFDFLLTCAHELGHCIGLQKHLPPGCLMSEDYGDITGLTAADIEAARLLYPL